MRRTLRLTLLLLSTAVIVAIMTMPWSDYVGHSHWDKVRWVPFYDHPLSSRDILGNVILFLPFGYFYPRSRHGQRSWCLPILTAAILSTSGEFFQIYTHTRIPSTTDICTNVLGAILGLLLQPNIQ
jgi:glycopeptide antibiotics resistance protein